MFKVIGDIANVISIVQWIKGILTSIKQRKKTNCRISNIIFPISSTKNSFVDAKNGLANEIRINVYIVEVASDLL